MTAMLLAAAFLAFFVGLAHSYLGERYILIRLFGRQDLPRLFGSDWFTRRTLRFAWHLTTVVFWGLAAVLLAAASSSGREFQEFTLMIIAGTFLISAFLAASFTRGRHLSWVVFLAISVLTFIASW